MQYDHIGSLCLSYGGVGRLPMTSIVTKLRNVKDDVMHPIWGAFNWRNTVPSKTCYYKND